MRGVLWVYGRERPCQKLDIVPYRISGTKKLLILHVIPSAGSGTETHVSQYPVGDYAFFYALILTKCYTYQSSLRSYMYKMHGKPKGAVA
jgi:hypothetical protein